MEGQFPLQTTILRASRQIYSEAMPVLYTENTFLYVYHRLYKYRTRGYNEEAEKEALFPNVGLKYIKHLELKVDRDWGFEDIPADVAATIQYFIERGGDLRTFELSLSSLLTLCDIHEDGCDLVTITTTSQEIMAVLVALPVSEALTISIRCTPWQYMKDNAVIYKLLNSSIDQAQYFVDQLALAKETTATKQEPEFRFPETPRDGAEDDSERQEDPEKYFISCKQSWCLRPRRSQQQQSLKVANASD